MTLRMPRSLSLLLALVLGAVACGPGLLTETAAPTAEPTTEVATVSAAPTPEPSLAPTVPEPTPAPTPSLDWVLAAPEAEAAFRIPLMVRHVGERSAILQFQLEGPIVAQLVVWRAADRGDLRQLTLSNGGGAVAVDALEPGVAYEAAVMVPGEVAARPTMLGEPWPVVRFTTRAPGASSFRLAAFGDSGFAEPVTRSLAEAIAEDEVDLVLHTGDVAYRLHEEADPPTGFLFKLYEPLAPLLQRAPFYPVPGNHEFDGATTWRGEPYYQEAFPPVEGAHISYPPASDGMWYAFSVGDVQFLMLNSQSAFGRPGLEEQTAWLEERIGDRSYRYSIVVLHVPPLNAGRHQGDSAIIRSRWGELLDSPRVPLVLSGHDHNYQRFETGTTTYVVTGGGSRSLYPVSGRAPNMHAAERITHYVLIDLNEGAIRLQAIDERGTVFDQAVRELPAE